MTEKTNSITAYKGFDKNFKCRDIQFEIGKTYEHKGEVSDPESGFYACENPLDVLKHYPPTCRFAVVKCDSEISKDIGDKKIACGELTVEEEIGLPKLISEAVKWIYTRVDLENKKINGTGFRSVASNMGNYSASSNTGDQSVASNTGDQSVASNAGNQSVASNTGEQSVASNAGNHSASSNTGDQSVASNTGDYSVASNTGDYSVASNAGNQSASSNTGDRSVSCNAGDWSVASNAGEQSVASSMGYQSEAEVSGLHSVACALGTQSKAKASEGGAIVCVYRNDDGDLVHIRASKVGENGIKADTWYVLDETGEFVEYD